MIFQKIHPLGGHRKIKKSGFGTPEESYEKLKPQGVFLLIKPIENNEFAPPQAFGATTGVCIRRGV